MYKHIHTLSARLVRAHFFPHFYVLNSFWCSGSSGRLVYQLTKWMCKLSRKWPHGNGWRGERRKVANGRHKHATRQYSADKAFGHDLMAGLTEWRCHSGQVRSIGEQQSMAKPFKFRFVIKSSTLSHMHMLTCTHAHTARIQSFPELKAPERHGCAGGKARGAEEMAKDE